MHSRRSRRRAVVFITALAGIAAGGCAPAPVGARRPGSAAAAAPAPARALDRAPAPASYPGYAWLVGAADLGGRRIGPAPSGVNATVVVVFASWCDPCRHELALLDKLFATDAQVRVVGVNAFESWHRYSDVQRMRRFVARYAPWLRVVRAGPAALRLFGGVSKIPTAFVFDRSGRMVAAFRRDRRPPPRASELRAAVAAAAPQPTGARAGGRRR